MIKNTAESHLRKLKGQSLQLAVVEALRKLPNINPDLIHSQVMSANGEDIIMDDEVRRELPISIECKKAKDGYTNTIKAIHQSKRQVAALAQQERKFISERVTASLAAAKARGVKLGGRRPNAEARHQAVRQKADDNARRVYDVIKSFRDTGTPYRKIATHLNNLKVPTANGGKWYDSTVRRYNLRMNA